MAKTDLQIAHEKAMKKKTKGGKKARKYGRNRTKCERYRSRVGKPRGRGIPGNKSGNNAGR